MAIPSFQIPRLGAVSGGIDWQPMAKLGDVYRETQNRQTSAELGRGLADGSISYQHAA